MIWKHYIFCVLLYCLGIISCSKSAFNSENNKKTSVDPDSKPSGAPGAILLGDLFVGCSVPLEPLSADAVRADRILIPYKCSIPKRVPLEPSRGMDIVFVLDVTGSMATQIEAVRSNFQDLIDGLVSQKWKLQTGAVAFSDTIESVISLKGNALDIIGLTDPIKHPEWKTTTADGSDKGGSDAAESGLVALNCGLNILRGAPTCTATPTATNLNRDKTLIYVSDAPAKNKAGHYDVSETATGMRELADSLETNNSSLEYFYTVSTNRNGLEDEIPGDALNIPTPSVQMSRLVSLSGIFSNSVTFPLTKNSFKDAVVAKLNLGKISNEKCYLKSIDLKDSTGKTFFFKENLESTPTSLQWIGDVGTYPKGIYGLTLVRSCDTDKNMSTTYALRF